MEAFGKAHLAFEMVLTPERKLSREDIAVVLENLDKQGYHLQMPPAEDEYIEHLPEELLRPQRPDVISQCPVQGTVFNANV